MVLARGGKAPPASTLLATKLFGVGTLLFSGSLYTLVLTDEKRWGAVTPIGGTALIAGWVCLALGR